MRIFAIILNIALFVMALLFVVEYEFYTPWLEEQVGFFITLSFAVPVISIITLVGTFRRSFIEEQAEALNKSAEDDEAQ